MGIELRSSAVDIAVTGLKAQALRMNVIANNIANSQTTNVGDGKPYTRKDVFLESNGEELGGVQVGELVDDMSQQYRKLYQPGHHDANSEGYVQMPNVSVPVEMMNMVTATRAYQASAAVLKRYQDMSDATLELLR